LDGWVCAAGSPDPAKLVVGRRRVENLDGAFFGFPFPQFEERVARKLDWT
jgi:hypothetical protein